MNVSKKAVFEYFLEASLFQLQKNLSAVSNINFYLKIQNTSAPYLKMNKVIKPKTILKTFLLIFVRLKTQHKS